MYLVGVVNPDSQLYLMTLPKISHIFTLSLILDLFSHILIDILSCLLTVMHNYHLRDIIRLEKVDTVYSFES